jgi:bifunctional UDP-N-acetylglucosamine pyrophosphorylase / glucosamine-1-phosphate N-acetyltransferase
MVKKKIIIKNQKELFNYFKDNTLRIKKNSKLTFLKPLSLNSNVLFEGSIILGKNNKIGPNCILKNTRLGDNNIIKMSSLIENTKINDQNIIGPFAFLRENTIIKNKCIVGAYVEVTRSTIKDKTYISHRAFIGDAKIGSKTIIGAGTVFCNYDFKTNKKAKSIVGSNCKIGSNSTIIAPINLKSHTTIPASTKFKN